MNNHHQRWQFIVGAIIIAIGVLSLINNIIIDSRMVWAWIITMAVASAVCGWQFVRSRETWAGVATYVTGAIALVILLTTQIQLRGVILPVMVMVIIGIPFLYIGLRDHTRRAMLIPAYVMFVIALLLVFTEYTGPQFDQLVPAYVMATIGLPFIVMAFIKHNYALLIPGSILLLIGLFFIGSFAGISSQIFTVGIPVVLIMAGLLLLFRSQVDQRKSKRQSR